jgi:hypothetical protein
MVRRCGGVERRPAVVVGHGGIGAIREEPSHGLSVPIHRRMVKRGAALIVHARARIPLRLLSRHSFLLRTAAVAA